MMASFERTENFLFEAAAYGSNDDILGVSECIIMGVPMEVGTGLFKLLHDVQIPEMPPRRPSILKAFHQ
jgi:DNA-directed RNA polymerase III subunit RPC1